jgi:tRNA(fMet)-specific endonuclease VapC
MLVLDTDLLSDLEWAASTRAQRLLARLRQVEEEAAVTFISFEEQMRGWISSIASKKEVAEQIEAYRRLKRQLGYYCKIQVLDFEEIAAVHFQSLKNAKIRVKTMDLKIASVVLANNYTLLTRNGQDFIKVPGLKFEVIQ